MMNANLGDKAYLQSITRKKILLLVGALTLMGLFLFTPRVFRHFFSPHTSRQVLASSPKVTIIAHRGFARLFPENTLPAFQGAYDLGADGVELDVQLSSDGVPVVIHDLSLAYKNTKIPTLKQALSASKSRGFVLIDLKESINSGNVNQVLQDVYATQMQKDVRLMAAKNFVLLRTIRNLDPNLPLAEVVAAKPVNLRQLADLGGDVLLVGSTKLYRSDPTLVTQAKNLGIKVAAWTIQNKETARELQGYGISTLICDTTYEQN